MRGNLDALKESLSRTPFFGGLEDKSMELVVGMLTERCFEKGDVIFKEGEFGRSMYVIGQGSTPGSVLVSRTGESGLLVRLVRLGPGDFFGEMALIDIQPRSMTVSAEAPVRLLELTNMDLLRLYEEDVQAYVMVLQNINRELCRRLRRADTRITQMADESGDEQTQIRPALRPLKLQ